MNQINSENGPCPRIAPIKNGRLFLPKDIAKPESMLILTAYAGAGMLMLYSSDQWQPIQDRLIKAPKNDPRGASLKQTMLGNAHKVTVSAEGSIPIDALLMGYARLKDCAYLLKREGSVWPIIIHSPNAPEYAFKLNMAAAGPAYFEVFSMMKMNNYKYNHSNHDEIALDVRPWLSALPDKPELQTQRQAIRSVLQQAQSIIQKIKQQNGTVIDFAAIPLDDLATYDLLKSGKTGGVYELDSEGMQSLLRKICPQNIGHLKAALALYRPEPLSSGMADDYINIRRGHQRFPHPGLEFFLGRTYGQILYREQFYQMVMECWQFTELEAKRFLYAIYSSRPEPFDMDSESLQKVYGVMSGKFWPKDVLQKFRQDLVFQGGLAMDESLVEALANLSYRMAWLKANFGELFDQED